MYWLGAGVWRNDRNNESLWDPNLRRHTHEPLVERLMHKAHFTGNASADSKSSSDWLNSTRFLGSVRITFFNGPSGNNMKPPDRRSCRVYILILKIHSYKCCCFWHVSECTPVCYCGNYSMPLNMTQHKTKHDWLLYLSVVWASWAVLGHSKRLPDLQYEWIYIHYILAFCKYSLFLYDTQREL